MSDVIQFELRLENGQFKANVANAEELLKKLGDSGAGAGKKGSEATEGFMQKLMGLKTSTLAAYGAVAGIVASVYSLGKSFLSAASSMQQNEVAFSTLLKSAGSAKALLRDLQQWSNKTPFGMNDAVAGSKRLLAFGVSAANITEVMTRLGDASMGNAETLDSLTLSYGKMAAKGKVSLEELNMMTERGVPIVQELSKQYGVSTTALYKMIETGKVSFKDMDTALTALTTNGGQFAGMMEKQSQTLEGMWSTFKDTLQQTAITAGNQMLPAFQELLTTLSDKDGIMVQIGGLFKALATAIGLAASAVNFFMKKFNEAVRDQNKRDSMNDISDRYVNLKKALSQLDPTTQKYKDTALELNSAIQAQIDLQQQIADEAKNSIKTSKAQGDAAFGYSVQLDQATENIKRYKAEQAGLQKTMGKSSSFGGGAQPKNVQAVVEKPKPEGDKKEESDWLGSPNVDSSSFWQGQLSTTSSTIGQIGEIMQMATDNELANIENRKQKKLEALAEEYEAEKTAIEGSALSRAEKDAKLKALDEKRAREEKVINEKAEKEKRKAERKQAERMKAIKITEVIISTASAIMQAFAQLGPIGGGIMTAVLLAMMGAQIGMIASQPLPSLAVGTMNVPQDTMAQLHAGEAVVPKTWAEGLRSGEMSLGGGQNMTIYQNIYLDGSQIGSNVEQYLLSKAANRGTSIYNNA